MTYQTPAPRYSRPIPASKLPPVTAPLPRHGRPATLLEATDDLDQAVRQLGRAIVAAWRIDAAVSALSAAIARERDDRMARIGAALGILAALFITAALASI